MVKKGELKRSSHMTGIILFSTTWLFDKSAEVLFRAPCATVLFTRYGFFMNKRFISFVIC